MPAEQLSSAEPAPASSWTGTSHLAATAVSEVSTGHAGVNGYQQAVPGTKSHAQVPSKFWPWREGCQPAVVLQHVRIAAVPVVAGLVGRHWR